MTVAVVAFAVAAAPAAAQGASSTARASKAGATKTLVIMVRSEDRYETVRIRLIGKSGRTLDRFNRRVRTNRKVRIRVSAKTSRAKVTIAD